ncbi:MAG: hypothetical protein JXR94_17890, partial [Candidatus Hydrogenedentes bacterium]|nr:hypothetical protein [Candidatus Hydrogenedentota bacterium]
ARNVAIEADVSFHDAGAPALVFRVEEDGGIAHGMCAVVVSARGVLLWRLLDDRWSLVSEVRKPVAADAVHVLRVVARGDTIAVSLNGKRLIRTRGRMLRGRGLVGILGRDGPCRFYAVRARALD